MFPFFLLTAAGLFPLNYLLTSGFFTSIYVKKLQLAYILKFQVPPTLRFVLDGEMPNFLLAKDLILQVSNDFYSWLSDMTSYSVFLYFDRPCTSID